eukprot:m.291067 g.291067  ORF g.291067 m.291067 type:complete len:271 (+) comp55089_c0_seq1:122-934(+)
MSARRRVRRVRPAEDDQQTLFAESSSSEDDAENDPGFAGFADRPRSRTTLPKRLPVEPSHDVLAALQAFQLQCQHKAESEGRLDSGASSLNEIQVEMQTAVAETPLVDLRSLHLESRARRDERRRQLELEGQQQRLRLLHLYDPNSPFSLQPTTPPFLDEAAVQPHPDETLGTPSSLLSFGDASQAELPSLPYSDHLNIAPVPTPTPPPSSPRRSLPSSVFPSPLTDYFNPQHESQAVAAHYQAVNLFLHDLHMTRRMHVSQPGDMDSSR